ncbi:hypothetical protein B296_00057596, partial [Ensete ventricosum]
VQPRRLHPTAAGSQPPASFCEAVATDRLLKLRPLFHNKTEHCYHRLRIRRFKLRPPSVTVAALVNRDFLYKQSSALLSSLSNDSTSHTTTNLSAERTLKSHCPSLRCPQPAPPLQLRPSMLPHSRVSPSTTEAKQSSHYAHHL